MEGNKESAHLKGELLIRSIVEEYRNVLEILEDPHILMRDEKSQSDIDRLRLSAPESLQRLTSLFSQLTECYNDSLPDCPFDLKDAASINDNISNKQSATVKMTDENTDRIFLGLNWKFNFSQQDNGSTDMADEHTEDKETSLLQQGVQKRTGQLKKIIDETRQLIWDIDKLKNH